MKQLDIVMKLTVAHECLKVFLLHVSNNHVAIFKGENNKGWIYINR